MSAPLSGGAYAVGIVSLAIFNPEAVHGFDGGFSLFVIAASFAAFLTVVFILQINMGASAFGLRFEFPHFLKTDGPFSVSRNPIYLSFFIPIIALSYCSVPSCVICAVLYLFLITKFVIEKEEATLKALFGREFEDYAARTPRWISLARIAALAGSRLRYSAGWREPDRVLRRAVRRVAVLGQVLAVAFACAVIGDIIFDRSRLSNLLIADAGAAIENTESFVSRALYPRSGGH